MVAAGMIMNDDIDGAEARLKLHPDSLFHQLGLGVSTFMRSILGFEKDIMAQASNRLLECENKAWAEMKRVQKGTGGGGGWFSRGTATTSTSPTSQVHPAGSEYALVNAQAQLMGAIVAVMHESVTDALRGFYKLRKAYVTLNGIIQAEERTLKPGDANGLAKMPSIIRTRTGDSMPGSFDESEFADIIESEQDTGSGADEMKFVDASERKTGTDSETLSNYTGHLGKSGTDTPSSLNATEGGRQLENKSAKSSGLPSTETSSTVATDADTIRSTPPPADEGPDAALFTNPVDVFVHSGANMCFGLLLLLLSMVPPAFSRLLYVIGFKGDRDRGLRLLWQATKFDNVNGAVAGLALLSYYGGVMSTADALPSAADAEALAAPGEVVGQPRERLTALLAKMRANYPDARLWQLEESRALAHGGRLRDAIANLRGAGDSRMRQVTAILSFELSLDAMFAGDWALMRDSFLRCVELNDWSHALYYYLAGCAEVELYRDAWHLARREGGEEGREAAERQARKHKDAAVAFFRKTPALAGKKKFMARQMPFEVYALRKVTKWEARAAELGIDLVDAIGVSPAEEMVYLWSGSKRMDGELLEAALRLLSWDRCTAPADKLEAIKAVVDESSIKSVCSAALLRSLGRIAEARELLGGVLEQDR